MNNFDWKGFIASLVGAFIAVIILIILAFLFVKPAHADGILTVSPTNNFHSGRGASLNLDINERLTGNWYVTPQFSFTNVQQYRDASGQLNLMYAYTPRLSLGVGYGHEKFEQYDDSSFEANDVHTLVQVKLW